MMDDGWWMLARLTAGFFILWTIINFPCYLPYKSSIRDDPSSIIHEYRYLRYPEIIIS
jgi:hypothetical protein